MSKIKKILNLEKLTNNKWLNLYSMKFLNKKGGETNWTFVSRKKVPECVIKNPIPDAVCIVPLINTPDGVRLVVIKEYRAPINDYEYGFPAGLVEEGYIKTVERELKEETGLDIVQIRYISNPIYSSAGLTDESVVMAFVTAKGQITDINQEDSEDIEVLLLSIDDLKNLLKSGKCVGAKSWGVIYHYVEMGKFPDINTGE
jgi:ADP-ribose pyrophosphatase